MKSWIKRNEREDSSSVMQNIVGCHYFSPSVVAKGNGKGRPCPKGLIRNFLGLLFLHRAGILTDAGMCITFLGCLCRSSSVNGTAEGERSDSAIVRRLSVAEALARGDWL